MKRYKSKQIVALLQQIEVEIANGKTPPHALQRCENTLERQSCQLCKSSFFKSAGLQGRARLDGCSEHK